MFGDARHRDEGLASRGEPPRSHGGSPVGALLTLFLTELVPCRARAAASTAALPPACTAATLGRDGRLPVVSQAAHPHTRSTPWRTPRPSSRRSQLSASSCRGCQAAA